MYPPRYLPKDLYVNGVMYLLTFLVMFLGVGLLWCLKTSRESFENIPEDIGNYLSKYFYHYSVSLCKKEDFHYPPSSHTLLKYLPETIPFDPDKHALFLAKGITLVKLEPVVDISLWECTSDWILDLWLILKPTVQEILQSAIEQSGVSPSKKTILHFRCADTPFIKQSKYYLQRYDFFKECLTPSDQEVTLMNCSTHRSGKEDQAACSDYVERLTALLTSLGYTVKVQCKTNVEDFADLFHAKKVISTGGSFSFMSGFFGKGVFLSTSHRSEEHPADHPADPTVEPTGCESDACTRIFKKGYNIPHEKVESYHDTEKVYQLLIQSS